MNARNSESALTNSLSNVVASLNTKTLQFAFWKVHIIPLLQYDPVTSALNYRRDWIGGTDLVSQHA